MADKNPFGNLGLNQLGAERQYMTSMFDPEQKRNLKRGIMGIGFQAIGAEDFFNKLFGEKPTSKSTEVPSNYIPTKDFGVSPDYNMSVPSVGINPNKVGQGLGFSPAVTTTPQQSSPSIDDENNSAWGHTQTSEFKPRDTSLDQTFAQGPVAPPVAQFPQLPQSTGSLAKLLAAFA